MNTTCDEQVTLLLVDDDIVFCQVLGHALEKRGFAVTVAHSVEQAIPLAAVNPPEYAVVDLKMGGASGLMLIQTLHELDPATRIVVLTGYASIATAVEGDQTGRDTISCQAGERRRNRGCVRPPFQSRSSPQYAHSFS